MRQKRGNPRPLPLKIGKTYLAHIKKEVQTDVCTSLVLLALTFVYMVPCGRFSTGWFRNISPVTSFTVSSTPSRNSSCESSPPFYPCQFSFPARSEGGVGHLHTAYRLIQEKPFRGRDDIFTRITDVFTFQQRAEDIRAGGDGAQSGLVHVVHQFLVRIRGDR